MSFFHAISRLCERLVFPLFELSDVIAECRLRGSCGSKLQLLTDNLLMDLDIGKNLLESEVEGFPHQARNYLRRSFDS